MIAALLILAVIAGIFVLALRLNTAIAATGDLLDALPGAGMHKPIIEKGQHP